MLARRNTIICTGLTILCVCYCYIVSNRMNPGGTITVREGKKAGISVRASFPTYSKSDDDVHYSPSTTITLPPTAKSNAGLVSHKMEVNRDPQSRRQEVDRHNMTFNPPVHIVILRSPHVGPPVEERKIDCNVPCFVSGNNTFEALMSSTAVAFTLFKLGELPSNNRKNLDPNVILKKMGMDPSSVIKIGKTVEPLTYFSNQFDKISKYDFEFSYRQSSEVFRPYFKFSKFDILKPTRKWKKRKSAVSFIANNCHSISRREKLVKLLQKYVRVDSFSGCLHNKEWPEGVPKSDKRGLLERYKVYLAAENSIETDYVTEKVYDGLEAGAVPVYLGAPNVGEFIPTNSTIIVPPNFTKSDIVKVVETIKKIFNDEAEYDRWTSFKHHKYEEWFKKKFSFTNTDQWCWVCRKVISLKEGYHWDRESHQLV